MTQTAPTSAAGRAPLTRPDGSPLRVLAVDDEFSTTPLLSMALRYEGWDVRTASDGTDAVRAPREFRRGGGIVDVTLPGVRGLEGLRPQRAHAPPPPGACPP